MKESRPRVRFQQKEQVSYIPSQEDMTSEEWRSVYYTPGEILSFRREAVAAVHNMHQTIRQNNESEITTDYDKINANELGLYLFAAHVEQRMTTRRDCHFAVLDEQWRQHESSGIRDDEAIAKASRQKSKAAKDLAHVTAEADAREVRLAAVGMEPHGYLCFIDGDKTTVQCLFLSQAPSQENGQLHNRKDKYALCDTRRSSGSPIQKTIVAATA